jgi:hypothetical protein
MHSIDEVVSMLKSRQRSNVKCANVKNVKEDYCPDCGAKVYEYGFRDGMRLLYSENHDYANFC